jgi:hypothetical protein
MQPDVAVAVQLAQNAARLSGELLGEYSKASVSNWMGAQGHAQ